MSNTYRHKLLAKYKIDNTEFASEAEWDAYFKAWEKAFGYNYYGRTPSSWNNIYHERPLRRKVKNELKYVDLNNEGEELSFCSHKKPHTYYW